MRWNAGRAILIGSGICDLATGTALLASPSRVFTVLHLPGPPAEAWILVRWLGVFVACVGIAGLWPRFVPSRLAAAAEVTTFARFAVAGFVAVAVCGEALSSAWLVVGAFDAIVALAQLALRARGDYA